MLPEPRAKRAKARKAVAASLALREPCVAGAAADSVAADFRDRDNFRFRGGFYGGFGPGFGFYDPWYDPFWGPRFGYGYGFYGYPYDYYPPPARVIVRERIPEPGYLPPPDEPPPEQNWYRCDNPQGFYPYVRNCNGPWQSVPVDASERPRPAAKVIPASDGTLATAAPSHDEGGRLMRSRHARRRNACRNCRRDLRHHTG